MILVHDDETLEQAIELAAAEPVHYSDRYSFRTVESTEALKLLVNEAFERGEIVLVGKLGEELPDYKTTWGAYRIQERERRKQEDKETRRWMREHPREIKDIKRRLHGH